MFSPFLSGMKSISFCTKKPMLITFVSVEGAGTGCSELYHDLQLSQKCPNFLPGFPGSPVNTRGSGKKEYPATPITYCHADVTNCFPGNTSLRPETVTAMIEDICVSLADSGFYNIIVTSGHADPTNAAAVKQGFVNANARNPKVNAVNSEWFDKGIVNGGAKEAFNCEHPEWDLHAGESETAFNLFRNPELIDMNQVAALKANWEGEFLFPRILGGAKDFLECGAPDAYFGDPASATAENGDRQYDIFSDIVVEEVLELLK